MSENNPNRKETMVKYGIDEKPPLQEAIPLGLQHVLAMFLSNTALPVVIATGIGLSTGNTAYIVQMALFVAGIWTLIQCYGIKSVGAKLPVIMGTSATFIGPLIAIGKQFGIATVFGASLVASAVEIVLAQFIDKVRSFFPPLVTGTVVMLIGLSLVPVGIDYAAGGGAAANYGSFLNLGVALFVLIVTLALNLFAGGFLRISSVLIGILAGYLVSIPLGLTDFSQVAQAGWFAVPTPLKFGLEFHAGPIFILSFVYVIVLIETIGDVSGTTAAVNREATNDEIKGGLLADGFGSAFASIFNAFPNTSYSQNVGVINFTGVASRHVAAIGGVFLLIMGLIPKVGGLVAAMPHPVLGGGAIVMFGMIFGSGLRIIHEDTVLNRRNTVIISVSIAMGLAVETTPSALQNLPQTARIFLGSGLISGGLLAVILNKIVPKED